MRREFFQAKIAPQFASVDWGSSRSIYGPDIYFVYIFLAVSPPTKLADFATASNYGFSIFFLLPLSHFLSSSRGEKKPHKLKRAVAFRTSMQGFAHMHNACASLAWAGSSFCLVCLSFLPCRVFAQPKVSRRYFSTDVVAWCGRNPPASLSPGLGRLLPVWAGICPCLSAVASTFICFKL